MSLSGRVLLSRYVLSMTAYIAIRTSMAFEQLWSASLAAADQGLRLAPVALAAPQRKGCGGMYVEVHPLVTCGPEVSSRCSVSFSRCERRSNARTI